MILEEGVDAILLVNGGVDSVMRGDEEKPGSILQDKLRCWW